MSQFVSAEYEPSLVRSWLDLTKAKDEVGEQSETAGGVSGWCWGLFLGLVEVYTGKLFTMSSDFIIHGFRGAMRVFAEADPDFATLQGVPVFLPRERGVGPSGLQLGAPVVLPKRRHWWWCVSASVTNGATWGLDMTTSPHGLGPGGRAVRGGMASPVLP
ncbi:hypothetical protein Hte_009794 [Hypoxylon texense]